MLCPFRRLTGLPCPGCGMTRAAGHLLRGEFREALRDHPLVPLIMAIAIGGVLKHTAARRWLERGQESLSRLVRPMPRTARVAAAALAAAGWVAWVIFRWRRAAEEGA